MIDSLGFNLPQQEVVTSNPGNVFQGESQLEIQKGQNDARTLLNLSNFASQVLGTAAKVAKPIIQQERLDKEQAGRITGLGIADNVEGDTYEERSANLKQAYKKLREDGEIGLIDDPYFTRGLNRSTGSAQIREYNAGVENLYTKLKTNPNFYNDPALWETEAKKIHDIAYVSLPENTDVQEGFLSNSQVVNEKYNQKYIGEANKFKRDQYLQVQQDNVGAALFSYKTYSDVISEGSDTDARGYWSNFGQQLLEDREDGTLSEDVYNKFIPKEYRDKPEEYLGKLVEDPDAMRSTLQAFAFDELVHDVQGVADSFHEFQGEGLGGLGVNPTDATISVVMNQIESPTQAINILSKLKAGTGKLIDTEKGKSAVAQLYDKAKREQELALAKSQRTRNAIQTNKLRGLARPVELTKNAIGVFAETLELNLESLEGPLTPDSLAQSFMEEN